MKKILLLVLFVASLFGCEKNFEAINENPYNPTETSMEALFNGVIASLPLGWNEQFYVHNEKLYEASQLGALTAHAWLNTGIGIDEIWNNYYATLKNIREIERRFELFKEKGGTEEELKNVRAMLKIITAYKTFYMTDLFGDIPFFDAGRGIEGLEFLRPQYDTQESIYKSLLEDLRWADAQIETNPFVTAANGKPLYSFGSFDALFKSNMQRWRQFANALRLRYAMRMVEKDRAYAEPIIAEIIQQQKPLVKKGGEIVVSPRALGFAKQSTHWTFREHKNLRMGTTIWNVLSPQNKEDGSGIIDPRAFIFFEPNNAMKWTPYPNVPGAVPPVEGGAPYGGQRDVNFDFKGVSCLYSPFSYYLIRDEADVPEILITAAEVQFLKAEAYLRGIGVAQDNFQAEIEYSDGIEASMLFWYGIAENTYIWEPKPQVTQAQIFGYIFHPAVSLSANGFKLETIYTQAWLDMFRQPWEAFALARRTGKTPRAGAPLNYFRLNYPASESTYNAENWSAQTAKMGGDRNDVKMWWML
jgi:hypothetical protein